MGRASVRRLLAAGAILALTAGCGSYTDTSPAAGVDELVIPTPSPDPDDFVATIDNPWLPLAPDSTWTYLADDTSGTRLAVSVDDGPTIADVGTTAVRSVTTTPDAEPTTGVDYYAQDTAGNVWWFGREGEWQAGEDGAEAGIAMLAKPRVGDGYAEMGVDGEAGQRSVIKGLDEELVIETTTEAGHVVVRHYEKGTGLVLSETPETELRLVAYDEPQP
jgi:hypothetical protein